jgi:hypothetical protein
MQAGLTKAAIEAYAEALSGEATNEPDLRAAARRLKKLADMFYGFGSKPLGQLLATMDKVVALPISEDSDGLDTVAMVVASVCNLESLIKKMSSRRRHADLIAFRTRLERHESATIDDLVKAVQSLRRGEGDGGIVQADHFISLANKIKAALGRDDQFDPLFRELEALDADGVSRVTDALMTSGSSKSRRRDLDRIRERHESQRALLAKRRAMSGRSAA